jgi:catechol 2,3-dioxygenase-like lactoylglutathione lyase family enzyme
MQAVDTRGRAGVVEYGLEVGVLPVSDTDKAKDFYQGLGWRLDADFAGGPDGATWDWPRQLRFWNARQC